MLLREKVHYIITLKSIPFNLSYYFSGTTREPQERRKEEDVQPRNDTISIVRKKLEALDVIVATLREIHDCMTKMTTPIDIAALQLVSEFNSEQ